MKSEKGKLVQQGKKFMVNLPTNKGSNNFQIPEVAKKFHNADAIDGIEVDVDRDDQNRILSVTIPGKQVVSAVVTQPQGCGKQGFDKQSGKQSGNHTRGSSHFRGQPTAVRSKAKASAKTLGLPFHNPYTFIPFPKTSVARAFHTLHSADEVTNSGRSTGILRLQVTTLSPLLTCDPTPVKEQNGHKTFQALTIGNDVIVPATGVRGALRSLLTVLTGGSLGYLNASQYLCQGRDLNLGPRGASSPASTPVECFLAQVERAGNARRDGKICMGVTKLVKAEDLERVFRNLRNYRKPNSKPLWVELDSYDKVTRVLEDGDRPTSGNWWRLRLSGRPVNSKSKREALFRPTDTVITLPAQYWEDYNERNKHGDRCELRNDDLVWVQPCDPNATTISKVSDIASLQWARWGRRGQNLGELVRQKHTHVLPDNMRGDRLVDTVTDMFGQVQSERGQQADIFAGRILPDNLVFEDAKPLVVKETLAPLAPPHPGCVAFYRQQTDPDAVSTADGLAGYKVYRTTSERENPPWKFDTQGIYGDHGELSNRYAKVNKTIELLPEGKSGTLNLSFFALTKRELALLIQACSVPWRLGGGKPLGLGLCELKIQSLIDEQGNPLQVDGWSSESSNGLTGIDGWQIEVANIDMRIALWNASQKPVSKLRYPRAVSDNNHKKSRGGHVWFQRHAQPRAVTDKEGQVQPGLSPMYVDGKQCKQIEFGGGIFDANEPMVSGQLLRPLDVNDPNADLLYGYDGFGVEVEERTRPRRNVYLDYEQFDPTRHVRGDEKSSGSHGKDQDFRKQNKER